MKELYFSKFFIKSPSAYSCYRAILDEQGIPYDYEFLEVNEAYEKMMGLKASNCVGKRFKEIFLPNNYVDKMQELIKDCVINNITVNIDLKHDDINKWLRISVFPLGECNFGCIFIDVTKEYVHENEIGGFLKVNLDMLCIVDTNGDYLKVNKKFEDILGYTVEELEGKSMFSLTHEEDLPAILNILRELIEQKPVSDYINRNRCKDGSYKYLEWCMQPSGKYIYASARDVTDKVKAGTKLFMKAQNDLLSSVIENIDVGFVRYSYPECKIIDINNKAYAVLKKINPKVGSPSCIKGQNLFNIYNAGESDNMRITKELKKLINKKVGFNFNYIKRIMLEGEKFFKFIHQPLFGLNNEIVEMTVISIDITEEIKAKNKVEEMLKVQEDIFANISHELKTPLNVIFSSNQLMEFYFQNDLLQDNKEKVYKAINIIKQNCFRFTKIINNITDMSKIESGFLKLNLSNENIVNITENIVQSVSDYIKVKKLNIIFDTNIEEKIIACDPSKIERIILNLISNAIKFTDACGSIFVNLIDKGDTVEISVKDTGIGMDKKHLNNIFKRFHQVDKSLSRNTEGSGIGLSIVKSIVELHSGKISAESKLDEGSIFKIELPAKTIKNPKVIKENNSMNNKIEMIKIEFSDIYSI